MFKLQPKLFFTNINKLIINNEIDKLNALYSLYNFNPIVQISIFDGITSYLVTAIDTNDIDTIKCILDISKKHSKLLPDDYICEAFVHAILTDKEEKILLVLLDYITNEQLITFVQIDAFKKESVISACIKKNKQGFFNYINNSRGCIDPNKKINTEWSLLSHCINSNNPDFFDNLINTTGATFYTKKRKYQHIDMIFSNNIKFLFHAIQIDYLWDKESLNYLRKKIDKNFHRLGNLDNIKSLILFFEEKEKHFNIDS